MSYGSESLLCLVATLGGLGRFPRAPGTVASLLAVALHCLLYGISPYIPFLFLLCLVPLAVWSSEKYETLTSQRDPPEIVVDEWVGQLVCLIGVAPSLGALLAGFLLFRVFDIIKIVPVRRLERLPGGMGVVADDVGAGLLGRAFLFALSYFGVV